MKRITLMNKLIKNNKQSIKIQFKKYSQNIWQVWTYNVYIRDITTNDIYNLCYKVYNDNNDIVNMSPNDFISKVWELCFRELIDNFNSDNVDAFANWFGHTVVEWYCEVIQGL
jgi:hypothetical protein